LANSSQARKRARQAEKRRTCNAPMRSLTRTASKKVLKAIATGEKAQAEAEFRAAIPIIDKIARKGIIHKNKAARQKARLNQRLHALAS